MARGPNLQAFNESLLGADEVEAATSSFGWMDGKDALEQVALGLGRLIPEIDAQFTGQTGRATAGAFETSVRNMRLKADRFATAGRTLERAAHTLHNAKGERDDLNADADGAPDDEADAKRQQRDERAAGAYQRLDQAMADYAAAMRAVHTDPDVRPNQPGSATDETGGRSTTPGSPSPTTPPPGGAVTRDGADRPGTTAGTEPVLLPGSADDGTATGPNGGPTATDGRANSDPDAGIAPTGPTVTVPSETSGNPSAATAIGSTTDPGRGTGPAVLTAGAVGGATLGTAAVRSIASSAATPPALSSRGANVIGAPRAGSTAGSAVVGRSPTVLSNGSPGGGPRSTGAAQGGRGAARAGSAGGRVGRTAGSAANGRSRRAGNDRERPTDWERYEAAESWTDDEGVPTVIESSVSRRQRHRQAAAAFLAGRSTN